jgi:hypothetical protein
MSIYKIANFIFKLYGVSLFALLATSALTAL